MGDRRKDTVAYRPKTLAFSYFLRLFVKLRWGAVIASIWVVFISQYVLEYRFEYRWLYMFIGLITLYNTFFYSYIEGKAVSGKLHGFQDSSDLRKTRSLAYYQILFDLLALFGMLHFSGGIENPFVLFFLFHIVISGILLETFQAMLVTGFTVALIFALGVLEKTGVIDHYHSAGLIGEFEPLAYWEFVLGICSVLSMTIVVLSVLSIVIMNERSRRRDQIIGLSDELATKNRKLVRVDQMRKRLMAVASHDLKSPIGAVSSYLMGMRDGYMGELTEAQAKVVNRSLVRLSRLKDFISDVLDWSTIERGELQQVMRPITLNSLAEMVVDDYKDAAKAKNITLVVHIAENIPPVSASAERMAQVFDNLVSNAIKYTLDGGTVKIGLGGDKEQVLFEVSDTGIGMTPADMEHLFEDFYRAADVKKDFEGTGLGLSVVHRIVRAHDGRVWAESEKGVGTAFFVTLPVFAGEMPPVEETVS